MQEKNTNPCLFLDLPNELIYLLFDLCTMESLARLMQTNTEIRKKLQDESYWRQKYKKYFPFEYHSKQAASINQDQAINYWQDEFKKTYIRMIYPYNDEKREFIQSLVEGDKITVINKLNKIDLGHEYNQKYNNLIFLAIANGHHKIVQAFFDLNVFTNEKNNFSPIMCAAQFGHRDILRDLIQHGHTYNLNQLLNIAATYGKTNIITELLDNEANLNIENHVSSIIHIAAKYGHSDLVRILLRYGANIDKLNMNRNTPLHEAIQHKQFKVIETLLDLGANPHLGNRFKQTPLILMAKTFQNTTTPVELNCINVLLERIYNRKLNQSEKSEFYFIQCVYRVNLCELHSKMLFKQNMQKHIFLQKQRYSIISMLLLINNNYRDSNLAAKLSSEIIFKISKQLEYILTSKHNATLNIIDYYHNQIMANQMIPESEQEDLLTVLKSPELIECSDEDLLKAIDCYLYLYYQEQFSAYLQAAHDLTKIILQSRCLDLSIEPSDLAQDVNKSVGARYNYLLENFREIRKSSAVQTKKSGCLLS